MSSGHSPGNQFVRNREIERRDAFQHRICGSYGLVLVVLGIVFPIASTLTGDGLYDLNIVNILYAIIQFIGILFILFLTLFFVKEVGCVSRNEDIKFDFQKTEGAPVLWDLDGVNFFVRLSAILFGLATIVINILRFLGDLRGLLLFINYGSYVGFAVGQTVLLLRYHKACIGRFRFFMRWGFAHLTAVNLAQCAYIIIISVAETLFRKYMQKQNGASYTNETEDAPIAYLLEFMGSLQVKASPYLYPCMIEYSLIMAAICLKFYSDVGRVPSTEGLVAVPSYGNRSVGNIVAYVISSVLGLAAIAASIYSTIQIFENSFQLAWQIFHIAQIVFLPLGSVTALYGLFRVHRMGWKGVESTLNSKLLVVAFFGNIAMDIFALIACLDTFQENGRTYEYFLLKCALSIVQTSIQVVFILDAMGRCSNDFEQARKAPGKGLILFLMLLNVALWILNVFDLKMQTDTYLLDKYYSELPWTIIQSICIPMGIFFRFYSAVCLADIFMDSYSVHLHSE